MNADSQDLQIAVQDSEAIGFQLNENLIEAHQSSQDLEATSLSEHLRQSLARDSRRLKKGSDSEDDSDD